MELLHFLILLVTIYLHETEFQSFRDVYVDSPSAASGIRYFSILSIVEFSNIKTLAHDRAL